jgi:hypothetical protein
MIIFHTGELGGLIFDYLMQVECDNYCPLKFRGKMKKVSTVTVDNPVKKNWLQRKGQECRNFIKQGDKVLVQNLNAETEVTISLDKFIRMFKGKEGDFIFPTKYKFYAYERYGSLKRYHELVKAL